MPAIVPPEAFDLWLDCSRVDALTATALLAPAPEGMLEAYEISPAVNRTANDDPVVIEPLRQPSAAAEKAAPAASATKSKRKPAREKDELQPSLFDDLP
jgi:hypothetical protein